MFLGCCASDVTPTASIAPANRIDASAVILNVRFISGVIYHADESRGKGFYEHHVSPTRCPSAHAVNPETVLIRRVDFRIDLSDGRICRRALVTELRPHYRTRKDEGEGIKGTRIGTI
jgi:hypothetical protein